MRENLEQTLVSLHHIFHTAADQEDLIAAHREVLESSEYYFEMTFCMSHADYMDKLLAYQHELSRFLCHMPDSKIVFMNYLTDNLFRYKHPVYKLFSQGWFVLEHEFAEFTVHDQYALQLSDEASQRFFRGVLGLVEETNDEMLYFGDSFMPVELR